MPLRISRLEFAAGSPQMTLDPVPPIVLIVGPNNAGKSHALRELEAWCLNGTVPSRVLGAVEALYPEGQGEALQLMREMQRDPPAGQPVTSDQIWIAQPGLGSADARHEQVSLDAVARVVNTRSPAELRTMFLSRFTVRLDGRNRFSLISSQPIGDFSQLPRNHLASLFRDDQARERIRRLTADAFGLHFVLNPTSGERLNPSMSPRAPADDAEERGLDDRALAFHAQTRPIGEFGDGVQAFTGLVAALLSLPHRIILIDEPDAFLHPVLGRRLGRVLAELAAERAGTLIAATHSADFLLGALLAGSEAAIVRLTYQQEIATATNLDAVTLRSLLHDPLLRSTDALEGLFHRAVVVAEADSDRAFYDEINQRLQLVGRGIEDARFINAQNFQTISRLIGPLRRLGVPVAGIVDLDAISDETAWPRMYDALLVSKTARNRVEQERRVCATLLAAVGSQQYKRRGLACLAAGDRARLSNFCRRLARWGVFIVEVGELECWLPNLGVRNRHKREWIVQTFTALGADPHDPAFIRPGKDDVWAFIDRVGRWLRRHGG